MNKYDSLDELVNRNNGYLCTAQALELGVSKPTLAKYVEDRGMERAAHGVYVAKDAWHDELYLLQLANSRIIFSHETALMLNGLAEREPKDISVTVKAGYNASHLRKKGVRIHQVKPELFELGETKLKTPFGNTVRAYDAERTLCDIIRNKDAMDSQVFGYAVREYMHGRKDLNRLMSYAKELKVDSEIRTYTEVLL